jgi:sec-independent protein translocase protein TatB
MFDLSWSHIALLLIVALIVLGPKELPNAIRTGAQLLRAGRKLAGEFRSGVDELVREAELDETRRTIAKAVTEGVENTIGKTVDPDGEIKATLQADVLADQPSVEGQLSADQATAELPGPSSIVIHEPPPAPPNSIVPPPDASGDEMAASAPPDPAPLAAEMPPAVEPAAGAAAESGDLKKSA